MLPPSAALYAAPRDVSKALQQVLVYNGVDAIKNLNVVLSRFRSWPHDDLLVYQSLLHNIVAHLFGFDTRCALSFPFPCRFFASVFTALYLASIVVLVV